uniref:Uncharacterized protein n=1 Tax=Arundo donax TaxID=35708 RepID=A0A0A9AYZ7_ARUDO
MASDLSSSKSMRHREKPDLPMILCPDSKWRKVVELMAMIERNMGRIFYICLNHKGWLGL